jgi:magnesium chelatase family protein
VIGPSGKKATQQCKCGYLGDRQFGCSRQPKCAEDYQARISGPLFDRIDLHVDVPAVSPADLTLPPPAEGSAQVAARVAAARARQTARYAPANAKLNPTAGNGRLIRSNADADGELLEQVAAPDADGRNLLTDAAEKFRLTARGYHRVLRVARTLADLDGAESMRRPHIAEALSYRRVMLRS